MWGVEPVVNETMLDKLHSVAPAGPGGRNRVRGVNSFARLPAFGGKSPQTASDQTGYRAPQSVKREKCVQSGMALVMSDYEASLTTSSVRGNSCPRAKLTQRR